MKPKSIKRYSIHELDDAYYVLQESDKRKNNEKEILLAHREQSDSLGLS